MVSAGCWLFANGKFMIFFADRRRRRYNSPMSILKKLMEQKVGKLLHVGAPNTGNRQDFLERADGIFKRNWFTNSGPLVEEFEEKLAEYLGVKHCITVCNGTVALEIAISALELKGKVIVPSLTFIATAHALQRQQITPVFCDIEPDTYGLDPAAVERLITPDTTGIVGVHLYSRPCRIDALQAVADRHGLKLMFDSAHAFGCSSGGRMIGGFGNCEVFSFHATKFFNSFEGGAITTNDDALAEKIRLMRNFGFAGMDRVIYIGTNGKMTEICAAMGLTNLESLDLFVETNRTHHERYKAGFSSIPGIRLMEYRESERCNWQYVVAEVGDDYPLSRDDLMQRLHQEGVLVRRYFWPGCHNMEPYRTLQPGAGRMLPVTNTVASRILVFPTGCSVSADDIDRIVACVREGRTRG
jgi:dTDP-4-amino-4,6-dideoxygalactose transaminase